MIVNILMYLFVAVMVSFLALIVYMVWINAIALYDFILFLLYDFDFKSHNIGFFTVLFALFCTILLVYFLFLFVMSIVSLPFRDNIRISKWHEKYFKYTFEIPIVEIPMFLLRYPIKFSAIIGSIEQLIILNSIRFNQNICIDLFFFKLIFDVTKLVYLSDIVLVFFLIKYFNTFKNWLIKFPNRD